MTVAEDDQERLWRRAHEQRYALWIQTEEIEFVHGAGGTVFTGTINRHASRSSDPVSTGRLRSMRAAPGTQAEGRSLRDVNQSEMETSATRYELSASGVQWWKERRGRLTPVMAHQIRVAPGRFLLPPTSNFPRRLLRLAAVLLALEMALQELVYVNSIGPGRLWRLPQLSGALVRARPSNAAWPIVLSRITPP
ncbi:hypothetical protein C8R44DRAFT_745638 [Mycena epipterygia]|nr:hypothetical protein C8R44DRAFT_745638 [Mycena epipterygia]